MSPWQSGRRYPRFLSFFMTPPKPQLATRLTLSGDLRRLQWAMFIVTTGTLTLGRRSQVSGILECQQLYSQCSFPGSRGRYSTCVVSVVDTLYVLGNHDTNTFLCFVSRSRGIFWTFILLVEIWSNPWLIVWVFNWLVKQGFKDRMFSKPPSLILISA